MTKKMQNLKICLLINDCYDPIGLKGFMFRAEKRDDVNNFVRKIRAKNMWNIYFRVVSTLYLSYFQSYSNRMIEMRFYLKKIEND